jgi:hypothetical protein
MLQKLPLIYLANAYSPINPALSHFLWRLPDSPLTQNRIDFCLLGTHGLLSQYLLGRPPHYGAFCSYTCIHAGIWLALSGLPVPK